MTAHEGGRWNGLFYSVFAALVLAAVSTLGDFIWARWIPTHQTWAGIVHGALLCLFLGAVLGGFFRTTRAVVRGALGAGVIGVVAAGSFYLLWPLLRWTAMFVAWMVLWMLMSLLLHRIGGFGDGVGKMLARGAMAAIASGLAFWAISGIWLEPDPDGPNYAVHFVSWFVAFLPGFVPLLIGIPAGETRSSMTPG